MTLIEAIGLGVLGLLLLWMVPVLILFLIYLIVSLITKEG